VLLHVYDLSRGKYDLTVETGPSFTTRREEAASQMTELIRAYPAAAPVLGDLLAKNLDWPDADEIAKRLQALLPAAANGSGDGQANAMVAKLQQQIAALMAQLQGMQNDRALDAEKLRIDAFRAQTDRLKLTADFAQKHGRALADGKTDCYVDGCGTGADGAPDSQFAKDASGNLEYSDEVFGPFSDSPGLIVTSPYRALRDGGATHHGGIDLQAKGPDGTINTEATALSLTPGKVVRIGATGFGPNAVVVQTPKGNWVTYGHLNSNSVNVGDQVSRGQLIGIIGNQGLVRPPQPDVRGTHLHVQVTKGDMFGPNSRFVGIPY
jgi:murein DD-endopeptidase MepM/ murein hydrolase activator NlpD